MRAILSISLLVTLGAAPQNRLFLQPNLPRSATKSIGNAVIAADKAGNWWQLNADGTTQAGSALTMVPVGSPGVSPLSFNGSTQYFQSSAAVAFPSVDFSYVSVVWVDPSAAASLEVVSKWDGATLVFTNELASGTTPRFYVFPAAAGGGLATGAVITKGQWFCMAGQYTGATGAINGRTSGANAAGTSAGTNVLASSQKHSVGAQNGGAGGFFFGQMRGVFFTEKTLSDVDVDRICAGAL